jgi:hypothetical protein
MYLGRVTLGLFFLLVLFGLYIIVAPGGRGFAVVPYYTLVYIFFLLAAACASACHLDSLNFDVVR